MRWHRSLYWRIALGVVGFLAAMLVVQAMLFVLAMSQFGRTAPGQSPVRLAMAVALDLSSTLEREPQTDVAQYIHDQYATYEHPFFVMMADGRLVTSGSRSFPEPMLQMARARLQRADAFTPRSRTDIGPFDRPGAAASDFPERFGRGRGGDRFDREGGGPPFTRPVPIIVSGRLVGVVVVPPQAPFGFLLGRYAPLLALVAAGVLILGTVLTSVMIFGPARRRLRELETAARRFGTGDLTARAPDRGGDEIAAVASAFNTMAGDLAARAEALAESDRVRRQLLADVSHELTTPITTMRGYLETLTMPELRLDDATRTRYLAIVGDETHRLERLIGDLLDLARLEGGGGTVAITQVAVASLFDRIVARHERACQAAGVTMTTAIASGAEAVAGDRDRLEQALENLAANALRYAPRGTSVRLEAQRAGASVLLSVEDAGPGIPPEHLPHIFDRFYKADMSRVQPTGAAQADLSGGSGLGLSIVKAIVERLGGRLTVDSRPGRTVFTMALRAAN